MENSNNMETVTLPETPEILAIARRVNWYKEPREAIANINDFLAQVMTYGRPEDVNILQQYLSKEVFISALVNAPAGIMDARSWHYWNLTLGRIPVPPMPKRNFES